MIKQNCFGHNLICVERNSWLVHWRGSVWALDTGTNGYPNTVLWLTLKIYFIHIYLYKSNTYEECIGCNCYSWMNKHRECYKPLCTHGRMKINMSAALFLFASCLPHCSCLPHFCSSVPVCTARTSEPYEGEIDVYTVHVLLYRCTYKYETYE